MTFSPCLPENDDDRQSKLDAFCQEVERGHVMTGQKGLRLHYCVYPNPGKPLLMIAPGRMEASYKYRELSMDFWHQGFEVVVLDHRGQGLSERFFKQNRVGHMDNFDWAAQDLITLARRCQHQEQPLFVMGHSMGASIAIRAMQLSPELFSAGAAIAPMLSLPLGVPEWVAWWCSTIKSWRDRTRWRQRKIVPDFVSSSRRDYKDPGFDGNLLTSSEVRYRAFRELYQNQPKLQLGGPTAGWLHQALRLMRQIQQESTKLTAPLLMLTAGQEKVVTRQGQDQLRRSLKRKGQAIDWLLLDQARHEIFEERDEIRSAAINAILRHFQQAQSLK